MVLSYKDPRATNSTAIPSASNLRIIGFLMNRSGQFDGLHHRQQGLRVRDEVHHAGFIFAGTWPSGNLSYVTKSTPERAKFTNGSELKWSR